MVPKIVKQSAVHRAVFNSEGGIEHGGSAWDLTEGIKLLVYGRSGTGKTTLWSSFPKDILALICSGGQRPGELRSIDTPENRKHIKAQVVTSTDMLRQYLEKAKDFATVVLDHGSGLQDLTIKEILGLDEIPVAKYKIAGKGETWGLVSQQQWGQSGIMCKELFRSLLTLDQHVVIICQERTFGEEGASEIFHPTVGAALSPSVTGWLNPACDYVVQTFIRPKMTESKTTLQGKTIVTKKRASGVEFCIRTEPHDVYMTKFRVPKGRPLPECVVDPSYAKINSLIRGE